MLSYWEKNSFLNYDFAIIGSGIVGLSTAISIKEKMPNASVLILERGILPSGASTKNAGFACFGSLTELCEDIDVLGKQHALDLVKQRKNGLEKLKSRLSNEQMDYHSHGGYELIQEHDLTYLGRLTEINDWLRPLFSQDVFIENKGLTTSFGFDKKSVSTVIHNPFEGQIDTGKMMKSLLKIAQQKGIDILTGAEVIKIEDKGNQIEVGVNSKLGSENTLFKCKKAAVCTNGFSQTLIPEYMIKPGRGAVLVTKPIKNLMFKGAFHIEKGYFYFRNIGDRVILGGGRHLYEKQETTTEFGVNPNIKTELERILKEIILPQTSYEVDYLWSGIMAFGHDKSPIVKTHSTNVAVGIRLGGMGVAIGSQMGEHIAELLV